MQAQRAQLYARSAGILILISLLTGGYGEGYAPSVLIVPGDPTATLNHLASSMALYRLSFVAYLVEAVCDVTLALIFYRLLRPVSRDAALLAAFFGLVSTATFAVAELFYFAPSLLLSGSPALTGWAPAQQGLFTLAAMRLYGLGGEIFMVFYGAACVLRGVLIFRSGYFPRILGALLALAGGAFVIKNVVAVLAPGCDSSLYALPMFVAMVALAGWFSIKGLDPGKWAIRCATGDVPGAIG